MITVYSADATDFSGNGLGVLSPESCIVTETQNGEYELTLIHPIDEAGKFRRLAEGNILRAPVPAGKTPRMETGGMAAAETEIWKVATRQSKLYLRSKPTTGSKALGLYRKGTEVTLVEKTTTDWYEVITPDGKRGYMYASYLDYVRTETTGAAAEKAVVEAKQLRDQPFRIYKIVPTLTNITAYARHIFYDLMDNMVSEYKPAGSATGAQAFAGLSGATLSEHEFTFYSDVETKAEGVEITDKNPAEAILGDEGLIEAYGGELQRDWWDVYLAKRVGEETGIQIREGKNLLGITYSIDTTNAATRIIPRGEDKDGNHLYLPEKFIENTAADKAEYHNIKWTILEVKDAKEKTSGDDKRTKEECYTMMREAARKAFEEGCDLPDVTLKVDFIDCAETEEYSQYRNLQGVHMGDTVHVFAKRVGAEVAMRMTQYTYNCLTRQYMSMTLGTVDATIEGNMINPRSIGSGVIKGSMLKLGSVGTGHLIDGAVNNLKIALAAIEYAHIAQATIEKLDANSITAMTAYIRKLTTGEIEADQLYADIAEITFAQIGEADIDWAAITSLTAEMARIALAQITTANIDEANIDWAEIKELQAAIAEIAKANITEANINEANINWANIGTLTANIAKILAANVKAGDFEFADVEKLVAGAMILEQGVGGSVYIKNLAATQANFVSATLGELVLKGSDGKYYSVAVEADGTIRTEETTVTSGEADAGQTAGGKTIVETSANIADLNAGTIKANSAIISDIFAGALEAGKVTAGEAFIASASIPELYVTSLKALGDTIDISANRSIRLLVEKTMGRNYLLATGEAAETVLSGESNKMAARYYLSVDCEELVGKTVTASYEWAYEGDAPAGTLKLISGPPSYEVWGTVTIAEGNTSGRFTRTSTVSEGSADVKYLYVRADGITGTVKISRMKLELGEEATGWAPAPEDLGETAKELRAELKVQEDGISAAVEAIEGAQTDIAELGVRADGIETRVEDSEGKIAELEQTSEGLKTTIRDEVAGLQTQISETAEGVEILAGQVTGGTQLLRETQMLTPAASWDDADGWRYSNNCNRYQYGDSEFYRIAITASGVESDAWWTVHSPAAELPVDWYEREITLSALATSPDWSALDAAGQGREAYMSIYMSAGDTNRGYSKTVSLLKTGALEWNPDVHLTGAPVNLKWSRAWFTVKLDGAGFDRFATDYEYGDCTRIWAVFGVRRNGDLRITMPKLEFGNVVTDWSAHWEELHAGSSVSITKNEVSISTPKFEVNIPNSTGSETMMSIDERGVYGQSIIAPNITQKYTGPTTLYVDPAATETQMAAGNYFRSLADACATLRDRYLGYNVTVNLAAGMTEYGTVSLQGTMGYGSVTINGASTGPAKLKGNLQLYSLAIRLSISYLDIDAPSGYGVDVKGCASYVSLSNCVLNGSASGASTHYGVNAETGAKVNVADCAIYNFTRPIYANKTCMVSGNNNKGNSTVCANGAIMMLSGTQPCGSTTWTATKYGGGQVFPQDVTVDQGDYPTAATAPTTKTYYATTTRTYSPKTGWATSGDAVRQGYSKNVGQLRGCMWFSGLTALSGNSILSATLRLTRNSTQGVSYGVAIELWGTTMGSGMTGEPVLTKNYGTVLAGGSDDDTSRGIVWGETEAFTIPAAAISDIAAGNTSGLMIVSSDSSLYQSKVYSRNYAGFSGASAETGAKPMLTVVYQ